MGLGLDWGAVDNVAKAAAAWQRAGASRRAGVWRLIAAKEYREIWPSNIPPLPEFGFVEMPRRQSWLRRLLLRLLRWARFSARTKAQKPDRLLSMVPLAIEAQTWLAKRNLRAASRWCTPFWYDAPTPLAAISGQGLAWAIACRTLSEEGPNAYLGTVGGWPPNPPLSPTAADCFSLHHSIDAIVERVARTLGIVPETAEPARRPGGLRTRSFLTLWPALCLRADSGAQTWVRALTRLMTESPMTRLVYADLLSALPPSAGYQGMFEGVSFTKDAVACVAMLTEAAAAQGSSWLDLWIALLARSLLGAMLSPSRLEEAVRAARLRLEEARQRAMARYPRLRPISSDPEVMAAASEVASLEGQARAAHSERMTSLPAMISSNPALRLRFNDMFLRRIAAECAPAIRARWRPGHDEDPRDAYFFPAADTSTPQAICFQAFEEALFGPNRMPAIAAAESERWRNTFYSFLPEGDPAPPELAERSGLSVRGAEDLLAQYRRPVALPIRGVRTHTAEYVVSRWVQILIGRLPVAQQVTAEEVTAEVTDAG